MNLSHVNTYDMILIWYDMRWHDMTWLVKRIWKMKETNIKAKHLAIFANEYGQCESALDFHGKTSPPCKQRQLWTLITRGLPYQRSFQLFGRRQLRFHCATDHLSVARECFTVFDDHTSRLSRVRNELKGMESKNPELFRTFCIWKHSKGWSELTKSLWCCDHL